MSAIGLPMGGHIEPHFSGGLCVCPCDDCTTRLAKFCVCLECPCENDEEHQGSGDDEAVEWITIPLQ
jgi:hypothetical protein